MRTTKVMLPFILGIGFISQAQANEDAEFMLGLGVSSGKSIYKGVGTETDVIPMFAYEKGDFYLMGPELGYHLVNNEQFQLTAIASYRLEGYEAGDSTALAGMDERKGAIELGIGASFDTAYGEWSATALADVSNEHDGYELALGWEKRIELSRQWSLTPEATISYRSKDLNNYYYGVKASEATANRAVYTADSGSVYGFGINADYMIDQQQMVRLGAGYTHYGNEISNSSIVEKDSNYDLSAMYIYRF
ncbi:MipA/OmpV family protein [Neptuniibacter caesariensis]|uniref:Scaffolding protein for murein-synthesizing holoenzyme putative outer membrane protein n=1 Tax=Neptuniibacter caesariensis TaxID=207954 RepID=A0A7U8GU09_NEPCE|nr:MipA/OmpV family protein [Neptuniibacter caesariensis]EAR62996.1 scaffolding protein for murein-synthesizing holoenzyme putative outer membrane protein [Oceanospirillum sp. MED92] [Neptuniibacter caesariensis]